jgi:hypothetical protein
MKITGFTIARNVVKYDYPILESIQSVLPICDEFLILVGDSEDNTREYLASIDSPKIKIHDSVWEETLNDGGKVLAVETDKALALIDKDADWCFYLQADEVIHEKDLLTIQKGMQDNLEDKNCEGFLFNYIHFYHSYDYISTSSRFYKFEVRIFRRNIDIYAYHDAQGFRRGNNEKIKVKLLDAHVYHYGWARRPLSMKVKQEAIMKYFHDENYIKEAIGDREEYDYTLLNTYMKRFTGIHPKLMQAKVTSMDWEVDLNLYRSKPLLKDTVKNFLRKYLNINLDYANYKLIK